MTADPGGARLAGVLAREIPYVLTGSVVFTWLLASSFVILRAKGFPKVYAFGSAALTAAVLVLALIDWYGTGSLSALIVALALFWTATTSAVLVAVPTFRIAPAARNAGTKTDRSAP